MSIFSSRAAASVLALAALGSYAHAQLPAFPGAEGYGSAFFYRVRLFQNACPLLLALFGFLIHGAFGAEPMRTWSSDNGKYSVKARLLERDLGSVHLEREDGKNISVATALLSEEDRLYLSTVDVEAFDNTVFLREGGFNWKVYKEVKGQTEDLAEAIQNAIGEAVAKYISWLAASSPARFGSSPASEAV